MTVGECIRRADRLKPNAIDEQDKVEWLAAMDRQLEKEFYPRYEREEQEERGETGEDK